MVTKINRTSFNDVLGSMDLGSIFYPRYIAADVISRYVRAMENSLGSNVETLYKLVGGKAEIMDQLRARVFDPTEFPDTESYIWFLRNNVMRTTGLDFPLPDGDVEQQARMMFAQLAKVGALTILEN